jgi:hypothetical protein
VKIYTKDIELVKVLPGSSGTVYSYKFFGANRNEFSKFLGKYGEYPSGKLKKSFKIIIDAINIMCTETGFLGHYLEKYKRNNISVIREPWPLRLYCIEISEEEIIIGNGGVKPSGHKVPYQVVPTLNRQVKMLESLRSILFSRFDELNVKSINEMLQLKPEYKNFTIEYEDETE